MKSKFNSVSATQNPGAAQPSTPTVPLSVYRELAAELQATRAMVDSLNGKNQQLIQQNQQLRQEVERFLHSARPLQQLVTLPLSAEPPQAAVTPPPPPADLPSLEETVNASTVAAKLRANDGPLSNALFTEEPSQPQRITQTKRPKDFSGIWLAVTVFLIVVTAFGAGFLIMRPLLQSNR